MKSLIQKLIKTHNEHRTEKSRSDYIFTDIVCNHATPDIYL